MPAPKRPIDRLYDLLALSSDFSLFNEFLEVLADQMTDVRTEIGPDDSIALRKALSAHLRASLAKIKRLRNNKINQPEGDINDDV